MQEGALRGGGCPLPVQSKGPRRTQCCAVGDGASQQPLQPGRPRAEVLTCEGQVELTRACAGSGLTTPVRFSLFVNSEGARDSASTMRVTSKVMWAREWGEQGPRVTMWLRAALGPEMLPPSGALKWTGSTCLCSLEVF